MAQQRSWLKYLNLSLMFIVLCCASVLCFAQLDRGSVSGIVTDPSGAGIAGAKVTVTNSAMGTQNSTVTTGAGDIHRPGVACGHLFGHGGCAWLHHAGPQRNHRLGWRDGDEST